MLEINGMPSRKDKDRIESIIINSIAQVAVLKDWAGTTLSNLKKINIFYPNVDKYFPLVIKLGDMPALEEIIIQTADLSKNFLAFVSDKKAIKTLSLRSCNFSKFPDEILEYTNLENLDLCYNNALTELPDALFALPNLQSFSFGSETTTNAHWEKIITQISKNPHIKTLRIACFPRLPENIAILKNITSLEITTDRFSTWSASKNTIEIGNKTLFSAELAKMTNLETLIFNHFSDYKIPFEFRLEDIAKLKNLHTLKIRVREDLETYQWNLLKQVKKLQLSGGYEVFPEQMNGMESLEELHLEDVHLKRLHLSPKLKNFHTITFNFSWKRYIKAFETVSDDFLRLLPQIKNLELNDIPTTGNVKIIKELQQVFNKIPEKITLITDIITKNQTEKYTTNELLDVLHIKKAQIDTNTWVLVEKRLQDNLSENIKNNIFQLENVKTYFLLGKSTKSIELNNILKSLDWKAVKDSKKADCIVVSRECSENCSVDFDAKKAVADTYLLTWAEKKTGFERFDESVNDNLLLLLKSEDAANQILALNLLVNAYTSSKEVDACLMAMALFAPNKELKGNAKKFIEKNFSNELLTEFKKHNRRGHEKEGYEIIKHNPHLDMLSFAETTFLAVKSKESYQRFAFLDIIALGGSMMPLAINALEYYSSSVEIKQEITNIHADFITHFPAKYTEIHLYNYDLEVQKEVFKLPNIKEIRFEYNHFSKLNTLHEDIGNMVSLEKIDFRNHQITEFPVTLAKLNNVKYLNLYGNELTEVPNVFSSWKNLETLEVLIRKLTVLPDWLSNLKKLKKFELLFAEKMIVIDPIFEIENLENLKVRVIDAKIEKKHQTLPHLKQIMVDISSGEESTENAHFELLEQIIDICPATLTDFSFHSKYGIISDKMLKFKDLTALHLSGDFEEMPAFITDFSLTNLTLKSDKLKDIAFLEKMKNLEMVTLSAHLKSQKKKLQEKMPKVQFYFH